MSLSDIVTWAPVVADSALVVSVCLLAYNLRASRKDARRNLAFSMMEQLTSSEFADRRWKMHRAVNGASEAAWKGFDDSLEDFECRAFAYQYELIGQMVAAGTLDYELVRTSSSTRSCRIGTRSNHWTPASFRDIRVTPAHGNDSAGWPSASPPS